MHRGSVPLDRFLGGGSIGVAANALKQVAPGNSEEHEAGHDVETSASLRDLIDFADRQKWSPKAGWGEGDYGTGRPLSEISEKLVDILRV